MPYFLTEKVTDAFAVVGAPARLVGRIPLFTRYFWSGFSSPWPTTSYAEDRFGPTYKWKLWLLFDVKELEILDDLINTGSNREIWAMRDSQIGACNMAAVIGALIVQAAITALQLPLLSEVHYMARGLLSISLIVSLLAVFFAWLQHRVYSFIKNAAAMRAWLSNGVQHLDTLGRPRWQSSSFSHQALQVPFELVSISITLFFTGIGVYLGSAMTKELNLSAGSIRQGNQGIFITFLTTTIFVLSLFGQLIGGKEIERVRCSTIEISQQDNEFGPLEDQENVSSPVSHSLFQPTRSSQPTAETNVVEPSGMAKDIFKEKLITALEKVAKTNQACAVSSEELAALCKRLR